eukprot:3381259-Lingulodinium_polyedra.AAC.1
MLQEKLASLGAVDRWCFNSWFNLARSDVSSFWQERKHLSGTVVGIALVELPGAWMAGPLSLISDEHRYFADLAVSAESARLAFFNIIDAVCIGPFAGGFSDSPLLAKNKLVPFTWNPKMA